MADAQLWKITYGGKEYEFNPHALTLSQLRHVKAWYPDLGTWTRFFAGFVSGDPDAFACAVWVCRKNEGEQNVPEPNRMDDVAVWESFDPIEAQEVAEDPTASEAELQGTSAKPVTSGSKRASTETPTSSEPSGSST